MASAVKFYCFAADTAKGVHHWHSDEFFCAWTNTLPDAVNDTVLADITEISGGGYTPGGNKAAYTTMNHANGQTTVILADPTTFQATTGGMGPMRYLVLYNKTDVTKPLVAFWDYGSEKTLAEGESILVDMDQSGGLVTFG